MVGGRNRHVNASMTGNELAINTKYKQALSVQKIPLRKRRKVPSPRSDGTIAVKKRNSGYKLNKSSLKPQAAWIL